VVNEWWSVVSDWWSVEKVGRKAIPNRGEMKETSPIFKRQLQYREIEICEKRVSDDSQTLAFLITLQERRCFLFHLLSSPYSGEATQNAVL
jgi:hypothetical protein